MSDDDENDMLAEYKQAGEDVFVPPEYDDDHSSGKDGGGSAEPVRLFQTPFTFLTCPLCLGTLRLPVTLPCGHNACRECMDQKVKAAGDRREDVRCPSCSRSAAKCIADLRPNHLLGALVAAMMHVLSQHPSHLPLEAVLAGTPVLPTGGDDETDRIARYLGASSLAVADATRAKTHALAVLARAERFELQREVVNEALGALRVAADTPLTLIESGALLAYQVRLRATRAFPALDHSAPYGLVVLRTTLSDFTPGGFDAMCRLPITGIAGADCVVIVGCYGCNVADVVARLFPAWGIDEGAVVAHWLMGDAGTDGGRDCMLWVAGYVGNLRVVQHRFATTQAYCVAAPYTERGLPTRLTDAFVAMFQRHQRRCILGSSVPVVGWDISGCVAPAAATHPEGE